MIAAILRHDLLTSWKYYIDAPSEVSVKAMEGIEEWFTAVEEAAMQVIEVVIDTP